MSKPIDVRQSFLRFPDWTQHFWTWTTGKALPHQEPLIRHTWLSYLTVTAAVFFSGLSLSTCALVFRFELWWLALPSGWVLTLGAARTMILVIAHQCIHRQFSGKPKIDIFVAELVTVLTVYEDAQTFKQEHFDAHHRRTIFATYEDPPVQLLLKLGFLPGMSRRRLWRRALAVFLSPAFYWNGFVLRMKSNFGSGRLRRGGLIAWLGWWLSLPFWLAHGTQVLALAFVLPIILMAQLSALLDKLGEHAWLTPPDSGKHYHASASWGRFCGQVVPDRSLSLAKQIVAWPSWLLAMLFYHLPSRLLVVVGDLPNHDYHHRYPATTEWTTAAYARQRDIDKGGAGESPYTEVWGMGSAIDRMFQRLSESLPPAAPPEEFPVSLSLASNVNGRGSRWH